MTRHFVFFSIIFVNILFFTFYHEREISNGVKVIIDPGMRLNKIATILEEKGLIKNKMIFLIWVKINSSEKKLKFGEYFFDGKISLNFILKKLEEGKSLYRKVTIIEGSSKTELLNILNSLGKHQELNIEDIPDEIIADTYFYKVSDDPKKILKNIIFKSSESSLKIWNDRDKTIPLNNLSEMFILASIVEKETSLKKEKSIISGVFYNRIEKNMKLQSDPTVVYAITLGKKPMNRKLLRKDLKFKSKFNTYTNKGLPPSPICFPGVESLKGVVNPYNSEFLYFVSKNTGGGHFFASDYKAHLENIKVVRELKRANE